MPVYQTPMISENQPITRELRALLDASPDAVLLVDRTGSVVALNGRVEMLFGTTADRLQGRPVEILLPERARAAHTADRTAYASAPTVRAMSTRSGLTGLRADGTEFAVEVALTPIAGSDAGLVMAVVHDVTSRRGLESAITAPNRMREALDALPDAILTIDTQGHVDFLNRAAEALTGQTRETARGRPLPEVMSLAGATDGNPIESLAAACLQHGGTGGTCEAVLSVSGEPHRALDLSTAPIHDAAGTVIGAAVIARDVTHARLIAHQLSHQATHDALTGLVNRREFERRLARALESARDGRTEHAVCFIDLDGFKHVNDICGHAAGDELLRQLSDLMTHQLRSRDTLARMGGDEFGLLLEHCGVPRAVRIAEKVRVAIGSYRFVHGTGTYGVGASIGVVPLHGNLQAPGDVLRTADTACYLAKRGGGNRLRVWARHPPATEGTLGGQWTERVLAAVRDNRFRLYGQPVEPLDGSAAGPRLEVLLRLDGGYGELLAPPAFLPAARREGLMPAIDRWVVREVIRLLAAWQRSHPGSEPGTMAVNLDDDTVAGGEFPPLVQAELARAGVPATALCFEICESVAVSHPAEAAAFCRDLRGAGCRTTIEHCGSGMAAFTLLRRLRPDYLKIAGHIVRGLTRDPVHRALATALNEVGHVLGLGTIAVHVENRRLLARLRQIGVDYAQGFGIAPPAPVEAVIARLE